MTAEYLVGDRGSGSSGGGQQDIDGISAPAYMSCVVSGFWRLETDFFVHR